MASTPKVTIAEITPTQSGAIPFLSAMGERALAEAGGGVGLGWKNVDGGAGTGRSSGRDGAGKWLPYS